MSGIIINGGRDEKGHFIETVPIVKECFMLMVQIKGDWQLYKSGNNLKPRTRRNLIKSAQQRFRGSNIRWRIDKGFTINKHSRRVYGTEEEIKETIAGTVSNSGRVLRATGKHRDEEFEQFEQGLFRWTRDELGRGTPPDEVQDKVRQQIGAWYSKREADIALGLVERGTAKETETQEDTESQAGRGSPGSGDVGSQGPQE